VSKRDVVQSHIEVLMEQILETDHLVVCPTGEIPVTFRTATYNVRVSPHQFKAPHVEVYAVAVAGVDADPGLYEALNEINRKASHARAFWSDRKVVVASELYGETLSREELECSCDEIGVIADVEGPRLAATFGGTICNPENAQEDE
jgi:hypothetical protein